MTSNITEGNLLALWTTFDHIGKWQSKSGKKIIILLYSFESAGCICRICTQDLNQSCKSYLLAKVGDFAWRDSVCYNLLHSEKPGYFVCSECYGRTSLSYFIWSHLCLLNESTGRRYIGWTRLAAPHKVSTPETSRANVTVQIHQDSSEAPLLQ